MVQGDVGAERNIVWFNVFLWRFLSHKVIAYPLKIIYTTAIQQNVAKESNSPQKIETLFDFF